MNRPDFSKPATGRPACLTRPGGEAARAIESGTESNDPLPLGPPGVMHALADAASAAGCGLVQERVPGSLAPDRGGLTVPR